MDMHMLNFIFTIIDCRENIDQLFFSNPILLFLGQVIILITFDSNIQLRKVKVDEPSSLLMVKNVLLRDRLNIVSAQLVPDSIDNKILGVLSCSPR